MFTPKIQSESLAETHCAQRKRAVKRPAVARKVISGLTALAVAISLFGASAAPSYADRQGDNLAKALAAALILGVIINNVDKNHHKPKPEPKPVPVQHPRVPGICAIEIESNDYGTVSVFPERCLREEGFNYRLPDCARSVRIYGERDRIYSARCLRDAGFRVDGY